MNRICAQFIKFRVKFYDFRTLKQIFRRKKVSKPVNQILRLLFSKLTAVFNHRKNLLFVTERNYFYYYRLNKI